MPTSGSTLVVLMRTSVSRGTWAQGGVSSQRPECSSKLFGKELGLFPGGEVTALVDLVEVDDVRVRHLDPAARRPPDLVGERREGDRDPNVRRRRLSGSGGVCSVRLPVR